MPQKKNNPGKSKQLKMKAELIPAVIGGVLAIIAAVISIAPTSTSSEYFKALAQGQAKVIPAWLVFDMNSMTGKVDRLPSREEIDAPIAEHLIVELYSK